MANTCKNYNTDNGDTTVIGGKLLIKAGATLESEDGATLEGVNLVAENQSDSTATDVAGLKTDFNALLTKLKSAGLMEADD